MQSSRHTKPQDPKAPELPRRRGPLPLDPALLAQVRGGAVDAQAVDAACAVKAPKGRW
jgi:hypothetical protein